MVFVWTGCDDLPRPEITSTGLVPDTETQVLTEQLSDALTSFTTVMVLKDGTKVPYGPYRAEYQDGSLAAEGYYVNGKEAGIWRSYLPGGMIKLEGKFLFGRKHGIWRSWDATGSLASEEVFVNGRKLIQPQSN